MIDATPVAWLYDGPDGEHYIHEHRDICHQQLVREGWTETPLYARPSPEGRSNGAGKDLHTRCTEALLRHRGCEVPANRDWSAVQFGEIAAGDVQAILATLTAPPASDAGMREALEQAARWFEKYAVDHEVKPRQAVDSYEQAARNDKAKRNQERADFLRAALSQSEGAK